MSRGDRTFPISRRRRPMPPLIPSLMPAVIRWMGMEFLKELGLEPGAPFGNMGMTGGDDGHSRPLDMAKEMGSSKDEGRPMSLPSEPCTKNSATPAGYALTSTSLRTSIFALGTSS